MGLDRAERDEEVARDLGVGPAGGEKGEDLKLPLAEWLVELRRGGSCPLEARVVSRGHGYDASFSPGDPRLEAVTNARLFVTGHRPPQLKRFALEDVLGKAGWLQALGLPAYASRSRGRPEGLQQALFLYH